MRISSNTIYDSNVAAMNQQQARLLQVQQQVSTGQKIQAASDDPVAAARILDISQSDAMNTQYAANRDSARHTLSLAESTLQSVTTLLQDVKTATINAGNGSLSNSDRRTIATELSGRLQELLGYANSTDGAGNYLFAGFQSKTLPFVETAAGMGYFGDDGLRNVQVSATRQMASSNSGVDLFMRVRNGNGTFVTQAAAANTGTGVISQGSIIDPAALTGDSYTVAYTGPSAQAPVAPATTNTGNGIISTPVVVDKAALTGNDYSIALTVPLAPGLPTYAVTNTTTGLLVKDTNGVDMTGLTYVSGQPINFDGLQFNIQDGATAFVTGDNFNVLSPGYTVTNAVTSAIVLPATTTGRLLHVSGQAINFDGIQIDIQGEPVDGDTFTVSPSTNESVFKTISDLIGVLNTSGGGAGLTNKLNLGLSQLDNALNNVLTTRSSLGLRLNEIDALQAAGENLGLQFKQALSQLQDVDYNQAISDLVRQQTNLQAAQQTFAKVAGLSLFDYL